uniref:Uncharacterized protein n=1 Tax=Hyaloperonospora arabidopsidis (strain Emoy2) TaxID=559515 RepID=M4B658_HYAAE
MSWLFTGRCDVAPIPCSRIGLEATEKDMSDVTVIVDRFLKYLRVLNPLILLACGAFVGEANPYFEFCYSVLQTPSNVSTNS